MRWLVVILACAGCAVERGGSTACTDCTAHVHPAGWLDPTSDAFHGKDLARRNWSFTLCAGCHGEDFKGGKSGVSCFQCHQEGPTACTTCHQGGPVTGAHVAHRMAKFDCSECHIKPASWDAPGHIVDVPLGTPPPINFGARARLTRDPADRKGPPTWDGARCTNVYCHGDALHAPGGVASEPRWDDPAPTGTCDRCHGAPPPSHARGDCATCHPANARHIDGIVEIGRTSGCDGCHGSAASPAPPVDLSGNTLTTAIGVGAHQAHLQSSFLRGPVPCDTCHLVPATVTDPGHLGASPAVVNASLGWDRTTQTCGTAWCHGPARPVWTTTGAVSCGSCHGLPPATASHAPDLPITACATCHAASVNAFGSIIVTNGTSHHMDGVVDAN